MHQPHCAAHLHTACSAAGTTPAPKQGTEDGLCTPARCKPPAQSAAHRCRTPQCRRGSLCAGRQPPSPPVKRGRRQEGQYTLGWLACSGLGLRAWVGLPIAAGALADRNEPTEATSLASLAPQAPCRPAAQQLHKHSRSKLPRAPFYITIKKQTATASPLTSLGSRLPPSSVW